MSRGMNYQGISVICLGDTTTTGGRVLEGVEGNHYMCDGIPVALKGHKVTFTNRPDERWQRTVYNMDGNKI